MLRFVPGFVLFAALSCASEPKVVPIVGPDGSAMFHVSCSGQDSRCYQLAGQRCPHGYDIAPTQQGNYLVRCRLPGQVAASGGSWAPMVDLAPSPYGATPSGPRPYLAPVPVTTAPSGYPPLGPGKPPGKDDVGY